MDAYRAVGADPLNTKSTVAKNDVAEFMNVNFELEVDLDKLFDTPAGPALSYEEFKKILVDTAA